MDETITNNQPKSLSEYADELRQWMLLSRHCQMMNYCYQAAAWKAVSVPNEEPHISVHSLSTGVPTTPTDFHVPPRNFPLSAGVEVNVPKLWKRFAAEMIDFAVLLVVKLFVSYLLVSVAGYTAVQIFDFDYAFLNGEIDLDKFYSLSAEIMMVEFIHRLLVTFYESFCLAFVTNIIPAGGFTPGKRLMGIAVVSCEEVFSIGNGRFLVTEMRNPTLMSALVRSLVKNFSLSLMIPSWLTVFMFDNRRTIYDIISQTIVIEIN